jgi:hypothetical protein
VIVSTTHGRKYLEVVKGERSTTKIGAKREL